MKDIELEKLFDSFEPELPSSGRFLDQLDRNINAIETVRRQVAAQRKRIQRIAVVSSLIGVVIGIGLTLMAQSAGLTLPGSSMSPWISGTVYALIAGTSVALAMNASTLLRMAK